jgi:hypothetical protein
MAITDFLRKQITEATSKSRAGGGGDNLRDGIYSTIVEKVVCDKMHNGLCIVIAVRILSAQAVREDVKPNAVGSTVRFVLNFDDSRTKDVAPKNWRQFLEALDGADQNTMPAEEISKHTETVANNENAYSGIALGLSSYRKMKKDKTGESVLGTFKHVPGQTAESIEANKKLLIASVPSN